MIRTSRLDVLWGVVALTAMVAAGCGQDNPLGRLAVSGTVDFEGKPLDRGSIEFSPTEGGPNVTGGAPIEDGRFSIAGQKGLPPGTYKVRIYSAGAGAAGAKPEFPGAHSALPPDRIPPEWNSRSDKRITVTSEGPNEFPFDIK